jgi:hypothetical protein
MHTQRRRKDALRLLGILASAATIVCGATAAPALAHEGNDDRVFATREGLVGKTTANGHTITRRDHFVALPSWRALSGKGSGTYSVRVCAPSTGRCAYAPVWDVGPWNTSDNYWSRDRQRWTDVPRGVPQAQTAYRNGYHGGKDQFGRKVANPAGIDLADGTFWDGLRLRENAWVDVTYLWTVKGPTGVVRTGGGPLNVRSAPTTSASAVGLAADRSKVVVECTVRGEWISGHLGTTNLWNRIGPGHYVSDAYLRTGTGDPIAAPC